jgi:hypothetical protein
MELLGFLELVSRVLIAASEAIAALAAVVCSDAATQISGAVISIDCGWAAQMRNTR